MIYGYVTILLFEKLECWSRLNYFHRPALYFEIDGMTIRLFGNLKVHTVLICIADYL